MKKIFMPFIASRLLSLGRKSVFYTNHSKVTVEAPRSLILKLYELCDGRHSLDQIIDSLSSDWDELSIRGLINDLHYFGILIDGYRISDEIWKLVENPVGFPLSLNNRDKSRLVRNAYLRHRKNIKGELYQASPTPHGKLLKARRSIRSFSGEVPFQSIVDILWSAYGETGDGHRTVPSAGALYPLKINVVFLCQSGNLPKAIYDVCFGPSGLVGFNFVSSDTDRFVQSFTDPTILEGAQGVIVINGSFQINSKKYGSRSLLFVPLEAGHVAQNINISAVEHDVATVEVGGFIDKLVSKALNLPRYYHPLIAIVFGRENHNAKMTFANKQEVLWVTQTSNHYNPPFVIALARVSKELSWSSGRDASPTIAYTKAISEAKEWAACGCIPRNLTQASFLDLENAINPEDIIRFHPRQYRLKRFPFKPFDAKTKYEWTEGHDEINGLEVYILADCVYFPYFPKRPYYAYANSSGVAAHPDRQKAIEIGTLELVERDSFMIAYLTRMPLPTIIKKTLPVNFQKRIAEIQKTGFRIWIKDYSLDLSPSVCIIAQNKKLGCTTCAACSSFDIEEAVNHALAEIEAFVFFRLQSKKEEFIKPSDVVMPIDHGNLYNQRQYFRRADFLMYSKKMISFSEIGKTSAKSWSELLDIFLAKKWRLLTVPLVLSDKYGGNGNLHIIRSIVTGIVPMTFGYRQEPGGVERLYTIAYEFGGVSLSYANITKFPHPFA